MHLVHHSKHANLRFFASFSKESDKINFNDVKEILIVKKVGDIKEEKL